MAIILSIGFAFTIVAAVAMGLAADRFGRRLALAVCLAFSSLFVGVQGLAESVATLTVFRALAFGFSGGLSPITNAFIAESAPPRIRGIMVGLLQCGYPIGWFLASILVVPLMTHYGWRSIFLVGFAVVPLAALVYRLVPESPRFEIVKQVHGNQASSRTHLGELSPVPEATGAAVASAFVSLGLAIFPMLVAQLVGWVGGQWAFSAAIPVTRLLCGLAVLGLDNVRSGQAIADV